MEWLPIVGYEGYYWVNSDLQIRNSKGKILTPIDPDRKMYYLRRWGQRERIFAGDAYLYARLTSTEEEF